MTSRSAYTVSFPTWLFTTRELAAFGKRILDTARVTNIPLSATELSCIESLCTELDFRASEEYRAISTTTEAILAEEATLSKDS